MKQLYFFKFIFLFLSNLAHGSLCPSPEDESLAKLNWTFYHKEYDANESTRWLSASKEKKGVILTVHGLNNRPSVMNSLANLFTSSGLETLRGSLAGHRGSVSEAKDLTEKNWKDDFKNLYCLAHKKAKRLGLPLHINCFSLGCLLLLNFLNDLEKTPHKAEIDKIIFISPAITVKAPFIFFYQLLGFLPKDWIIPSLNLANYRFQEGTTVASYEAFFQFLDKNKSLSTTLQKTWKKIPTMIFMNPEDELLDFKKFKDFIDKNNLESWKINLINNDQATTSKVISHLLLDKKSVGAKAWSQMKEKILQFLDTMQNSH